MDNSNYKPRTSPQNDIKTESHQPNYPSAYGTYRRSGKSNPTRNSVNGGDGEGMFTSFTSPFFNTPPHLKTHLNSPDSPYEDDRSSGNSPFRNSVNNSLNGTLHSKSNLNYNGFINNTNQGKNPPQQPTKSRNLPQPIPRHPQPPASQSHNLRSHPSSHSRSTSLNFASILEDSPQHPSNPQGSYSRRDYGYYGSGGMSTQAEKSDDEDSFKDSESVIDANKLSYFRDEDSEASDPETEHGSGKGKEKKGSSGLGLTNTNISEYSQPTTHPKPTLREMGLEREILELRAALTQHKLTVGTISSELSKAQFHITQLNHQIKDINHKNLDTSDKLKSVTIRCIQAEKQVGELNSNNSELNDRLKRYEDENHRLGEENERLSGDIDDLRDEKLKRETDGGTENDSKELEAYKSQIKGRADFAKNELDHVVKEAKLNIEALIRGMGAINRVTNVLSGLDKLFPEPELYEAEFNHNPNPNPDP